MFKNTLPPMNLIFLLFLWIDLVDSIFFGNSCGCQPASPRICPAPVQTVCSPAPISAPIIPPPRFQAPCPPCDCRGGGIGIVPVSSHPTLIQTASIPQQAISIGGGSYATPQIIQQGPHLTSGPQLIQNPTLTSGPQLLPNPTLTSGPQLIPGPNSNSYQSGSDGSNYLNPSRGEKIPNFFTTSRPHFKHSSRNSIEDVYDEVLPTSGQQAADVSVDSKKLVPYDVFLKRNRFLKQLRNRALRQFSAKSIPESARHLDEEPNEKQSVCNNEKLSKLMQKAMMDDITVSKKMIRKAAELAFDGKRFDVLCAVGDFSYSVYAKMYCEASHGNMTCFAFI